MSNNAGGQRAAGLWSATGMIKSARIMNFRGLQDLTVNDFARINVIVGDNAVGKTTLLEALFLTLSGNPDKGLLLKQWRGMDIRFQNNSGDSLFDAIYADLFHDLKALNPIHIQLTGEGFENRSLRIEHGSGDVFVPIEAVQPHGNRKVRRAAKSSKKKQLHTLSTNESIVVPIVLTWTDEIGHGHTTRILLTPQGLRFEGTTERIPNCFLYAAQVPVPFSEAAQNYAKLLRDRDGHRFRSAFMSIFDEIRDLIVDANSGASTIMADVPWAKQLLPLPAVSGGTNRASAILLALAFRQNGIVLVDEIESGIYHARQKRFSDAILTLSREYNSQLIVTTHSQEWIENFIEAAKEHHESIAFWRMERLGNGGPTIRRFTVAQFADGMTLGEMR